MVTTLGHQQSNGEAHILGECAWLKGQAHSEIGHPLSPLTS